LELRQKTGSLILNAGGDTSGSSSASSFGTGGGNTSSAGRKVTRKTFATCITSLSTGAEAVVGEITRTGKRSTNNVGREKLAGLPSTTIEFPDSFGGLSEITLFAGVDDTITTSGSDKNRRGGNLGRRRDERRSSLLRRRGDSTRRRRNDDHGRRSSDH